jgi:hypothetical protein
LHGIVTRSDERVGPHWVRDQDFALQAPITREHDEMADRLAADVVVGIGLRDVAHRAVEIGRAQPRDDGPALHVLAQQGRLEIAQQQLAAQPQEFIVAARRSLDAPPRLDLGLRREPRAKLVARQVEPSRVE